jgi:endonuclease/exonuclease/phosphatase family metal-dependent hydrolase
MLKKRHLRVLSYNIHKGFSSGNRRFILGKIRESIRLVHADLVFLQEVQGEHEVHRTSVKDWPKASQFEFLADETWPHFAYGKNAVYDFGHHGNALLSKYPITFWENIDVSTNRFESRGLLHAKIAVPEEEQPVHAICVHLGLRENDRGIQIRRICERIQSHVPHSEPVIIAGDFNDWRGRATAPLRNTLGASEAFEQLRGSHARTFPSWLPALRLDRVYFRGLEAKKVELLMAKPWNELSDHAALSVEFVVKKALSP